MITMRPVEYSTRSRMDSWSIKESFASNRYWYDKNQIPPYGWAGPAGIAVHLLWVMELDHLESPEDQKNPGGKSTLSKTQESTNTGQSPPLVHCFDFVASAACSFFLPSALERLYVYTCTYVYYIYICIIYFDDIFMIYSYLYTFFLPNHHSLSSTNPVHHHHPLKSVAFFCESKHRHISLSNHESLAAMSICWASFHLLFIDFVHFLLCQASLRDWKTQLSLVAWISFHLWITNQTGCRMNDV